MDAVPLLGSEETEKTEPSVSPSTSVAERVAVIVESSSPVPEVLPVIVAASSTLAMVCAAEMKSVDQPRGSVAMAATRTSWPTRD